MDAYPERRAYERKRVLLRGALDCRGHSFASHVRDISLGGAEVDMDLPLSTGVEVGLDISRVGHFNCRIAWQSGQRMGVEFIDDLVAIRTKLERGMLMHRPEQAVPVAH